MHTHVEEGTHKDHKGVYLLTIYLACRRVVLVDERHNAIPGFIFVCWHISELVITDAPGTLWGQSILLMRDGRELTSAVEVAGSLDRPVLGSGAVESPCEIVRTPSLACVLKSPTLLSPIATLCWEETQSE